MSETSLAVSYRDLHEQWVAFATYQADQSAGDFDPAIRAVFDRVKEWVSRHGVDPGRVPAIGIAQVVNGQLQAYQCCIPVEEDLPVEEGSDVAIQRLPGGRYAVLRIDKQPELIGEAIQRFFAEFVPQEGLQIDASRPIYEIYWEAHMDFCVPLLT